MTPERALLQTWRADRSGRRKKEATLWYPDANAWAHSTARRYNVAPALVVDLLAVLSPGTRWDINKFDAERVLHYGKLHRPTTWPPGREKAYALLEGYAFDDLVSERSSPKVWNFRNNIADPRRADFVTIDRWVARAAGFPERVHYGRYQELATLYKRCAARLGVLPNVLQAFVWIKTRNENRFGSQGEIPF